MMSDQSFEEHCCRFEELLVNGELSYGIVQPGEHSEDNSVPIIRVNNVRNGRISAQGILRVSKEIESRYSRTRLRGGELLVVVVGSGTVGNCLIVPPQFAGWNVARAIAVARLNENCFPPFIVYQFRTEDFRHQVYGGTTDTAQPTLNLSSLRQFTFRLPALPEQRAIANVLSSFEDKLDLLHRENKTLEAMVETLFRQWFVEEASDDWERRPLSSIANFLNGLACQKCPPVDFNDRLPVLKIKELTSGIGENCDFASAKVKPEYIVEPGDVIFSWSATLMVKIWDGPRCVLNQHLFKVTSAGFPKWFVYLWCKHHLTEFISISSAHATTMGHIKRGDLDQAIVIVPPEVDLKEMSTVASPLIAKFEQNAAQLFTLQKLRDTLLPKLMSGEVRVQYE